MNRAVLGNRIVWLMLLIALLLRLALAIGVQNHVSQIPGRLCLIPGDAEGYWELAGKIAACEDYSIYDPPRRLLRMPGFPALLALPRLVFGSNSFTARLVLACVGTLACGLTCWLGRELVGETVGLIAGAYTAISPTMALFSVLFLSETAFAAALLASLIAASKLIRRLSETTSSGNPRLSGRALVTGGLIGLATYMRPTWLLMGPGLAIVIAVIGTSTIRSRCVVAGCLCLGLTISLLPWTVRNYFVTGHVIPTTLWVGPSLYDGLNPQATGDSDMNFFERDNLLQTMSEYEMDRIYRQRAWAFAYEHPGRAVTLALVKQWRYWSPAPNGPQFNHALIHIVAWIFYLPLIVFSIMAIWSRWDRRLILLTATPILYFAALHLLFVGSLRYRLPAEYPLAVLAAAGVSRFFNWGKGGDTPLASSR